MKGAGARQPSICGGARERAGNPLALERAYPLPLRVMDADCAALGVSRSSHAEDFEWLARRFFSAYAEMASHDFVRRGARRPNVVLRDQEMISRRRLETNMMYHRARRRPLWSMPCGIAACSAPQAGRRMSAVLDDRAAAAILVTPHAARSRGRHGPPR